MHTFIQSLKLGCLAICLIALIPCIWAVFSAFEPEIMLYQAERIAGDRPYCIVVSDKNREMTYKEVTSKSELTFNNLTTTLNWGGSGDPMGKVYYALLIMRNPDDVWNWSKTVMDFKDDVQLHQWSLYKRDYTSFCNARSDFAKMIPFFS